MAKICCVVVFIMLVGCEAASKVDTKDFLQSLDSLEAQNTIYSESIIGKQDEALTALDAIKSQVAGLNDAVQETRRLVETKQAGDMPAYTEAVVVDDESEPVSGKEVIQQSTSTSSLDTVADDDVHFEVWTATWCGPCRRQKPVTARVAKDLGLEIMDWDWDEYKRYAAASKVSSLPTLNIVRRGKARRQLIGPQTAASIHAAVDAVRAMDLTDDKPNVSAINQVQSSVQSVSRYVQWGNTTYDMETWRRMCSMLNCGMCQYLDAKCEEYQRSKAMVSSSDVPSPQSASPMDVVTEAIAIAKLTPEDVVAELGSGDGKPAIQMVKASGCRVIGVEIDPDKVLESRANIAAAGLSDRITIIEGDVRDFDPSSHSVTVVYAYLYPALLNEIKPALSAGRITICPGHKADGLGMRLVGQCWVRDGQEIQTVNIDESGAR